uniref:Uncharacterized protein n=1 Tax=Oryza brachyantha TaxID=4533 RepID=J3MH09_ORYBR
MFYLGVQKFDAMFLEKNLGIKRGLSGASSNAILQAENTGCQCTCPCSCHRDETFYFSCHSSLIGSLHGLLKDWH